MALRVCPAARFLPRKTIATALQCEQWFASAQECVRKLSEVNNSSALALNSAFALVLKVPTMRWRAHQPLLCSLRDFGGFVRVEKSRRVYVLLAVNSFFNAFL